MPDVPGFDGAPGSVAPDDYLGWLTVFWDALDATGALPVPGGRRLASAGCSPPTWPRSGPRRSPPLALLAPFGIVDGDNPGFDLYAVPAAERMAHLFAKGVPEPFADRFGDLGPEEAPVARYLVRRRRRQPAVAARRPRPGRPPPPHHAARRSSLWGDQDELLPPGRIERWGGGTVIAGAGHLAEWDAPDEVAAALRALLAQP